MACYSYSKYLSWITEDLLQEGPNCRDQKSWHFYEKVAYSGGELDCSYRRSNRTSFIIAAKLLLIFLCLLIHWSRPKILLWGWNCDTALLFITALLLAQIPGLNTIMTTMMVTNAEYRQWKSWIGCQIRLVIHVTAPAAHHTCIYSYTIVHCTIC